MLRNGILNFRGRIAPGQAFGSGGEGRNRRIPTLWQFALLDLFQLAGQFRKLLAIFGELRHPSSASAVSTLPELFFESIVYAIGHQELRVFRPAVIAFRKPDLFLAQWLPVRRAGVLLVRRAVSDVAIHNDEGRTVFGRQE